MLVLSRKATEQIQIGDVLVTILSLHGNRVKLGITAPRDTRVQRRELIAGEDSDADELMVASPGKRLPR